jgi:hypothetical protein
MLMMRPYFLLHHARHHRLRAVPRAFEIDVDGLVAHLVRHIHERRKIEHRNIVDQDVHLPEILQHRVQSPCDLTRIGDVDLESSYFLRCCICSISDVRSRCLRGIGDVEYHHPCTFGRHGPGYTLADALGRPRYNGRFSRQSTHEFRLLFHPSSGEGHTIPTRLRLAISHNFSLLPFSRMQAGRGQRDMHSS